MSKYIIDLNDKDKEVCEKYVNCELGDELSDYVNVTELAGAIANATPVTEGDLIMFRTLMTEIANKGLPFEEVLLLIDNAKTPCNPSGDLISRELLKKDIEAQISDFSELDKKGEPYKEFKDIRAILFGLFIGKNLIENASPVEEDKIIQCHSIESKAYVDGFKKGYKEGERTSLDLAKEVIVKFEGYLDEDMIERIQIALENEIEGK